MFKNFENKFVQVSLTTTNDNKHIDGDKACRKVKNGFELETLNKNGLQQLKYFIINM